jgi:hypothetical protein
LSQWDTLPADCADDNCKEEHPRKWSSNVMTNRDTWRLLGICPIWSEVKPKSFRYRLISPSERAYLARWIEFLSVRLRENWMAKSLNIDRNPDKSDWFLMWQIQYSKHWNRTNFCSNWRFHNIKMCSS